MLLYLIRHAQSANNDLYARTGDSVGRLADPPLTEIGHRQAQLLAHHLSARSLDNDPPPNLIGKYADRHDRLGYGLTHLYCSLMTRAIQTAGYIAAATGLPLVAWPEIHERGGLHEWDEASGEDVGVAGPGRAHFTREYPHLILPDTLDDTGWWNRPYETVEESFPRARLVWRQLLERHGDGEDRVGLVLHGGFFQALLLVLLGFDETPGNPGLGINELGFGISNASITRIEINQQRAGMRYLNKVDHLPSEFITG
jgi:2,3-bisphosphoglycerate-dependent phosphoglycerate mutase